MYASNQALRSRFVDQSVDTASPSRVVVLLFERLCLDIQRAEQALNIDDYATAHANSVHAQDILMALLIGLDEQWSQTKDLGAIYNFLITQLVTANTSRSAELTAKCLDVAEELRDMWTEAARLAAAQDHSYSMTRAAEYATVGGSASFSETA